MIDPRPSSSPSIASAWTRRELVRSATLLGASAVAAGVWPRAAAASRQATELPLLKVGIIGCGGRGTGAALQAVRADANVVLWSAGDVFPEQIETCVAGLTEELGELAATKLDVAAERRFVGFDSYEKVIASGVDVVILTTPPGFRPAHFKAAIDAGKHVFLEKPVAVDGPGIRMVLAAAEDAKRKKLSVVCGFCWRYNAGMRATFKQINSGAIGDVVAVHTTYHSSTLSKRPRVDGWTDMEFQLRNWWHFTWLAGDHVVEQAVHSVDRLAWATGDVAPARAVCLGGRAARFGPEHGNAYDHFAVIYEYDDGKRAYHTCRQIDGCPSDNTDYVYGTQGSAVINGWTPQYDLTKPGGEILWKHEGEIADMYQVEHDELFASIRKGEPISDGDKMVRSTLMAIMARMAAYTGQTIGYQQALESQESLVPEKLGFGEVAMPEVAVPGKTKFA